MWIAIRKKKQNLMHKNWDEEIKETHQWLQLVCEYSDGREHNNQTQIRDEKQLL